MPSDQSSGPMNGRHVTIAGRVQGVGFRPFVYRLAHELELTGWVLNAAGVVEAEVQGSLDAIDAFARRVIDDAPPLARPELLRNEAVSVEPADTFAIRHSEDAGEPDIHVPPDQFLCADCVAEMSDPKERRYRYPFINCTQCGPRYTIIRALPYDRPNTTLAGFPLCPDCHAEYTNPLDRRFHAQPLACPVCGPSLRLVRNGKAIEGNEEALRCALACIRNGEVIAIRGVGGYHLVCQAANEAAVARLRERKHRPDKPLAVMVPMRGTDGLDAARELAELEPNVAAQLADPERPIVLAPMKPGAALADGIAPGLNEVGLMLPYAPLHHLLLTELGQPIVATSGNLSGEPVLTDPDEAERRLADICDAFLHHDRPIQRPADDPVWRAVAGEVRPIRLGRGNAPLELTLPVELETPTLAVGAFLKNTIALAWKRRVVISPHIGELESPRAVEVFEQVVGDLQALYGIEAERVVSDAHPDFPNTRWARDSGLPAHRVFHHEAHASALAGEFERLEDDLLVFAWDGVGYGRDGQAWGGEALVGRPGAWQRRASLRTFRLPGGDRAIRQPWRSAQSIAWHAGFGWPEAPEIDPLLHQAWTRGLASPWTSAAGRLFDAAATLLGLGHESSFEGQGPARLEALARRGSPAALVPELPLEEDKDGVLRLDWAPLMTPLLDGDANPANRAMAFHQGLSQGLVKTACALGDRFEFSAIGLTGGVFQNALLAELVIAGLQDAGFDALIPRRVPVNDAGIAYGQIIESAVMPGPA